MKSKEEKLIESLEHFDIENVDIIKENVKKLIKSSLLQSKRFDKIFKYADRQQLEMMRLKDVAEVATQAKSEFLANMSHEIRTL